MEDLADNARGITPWRRSFDRLFVDCLEQLVKMVATHWLALANLAAFLFVSLAVLAPALMAAGYTLPARAIYLVYKAFCHQLPHRSYFIFDHQMAFCQRDFAIYASMFAAGVAFAFIRERLGLLDWRLYLVLIAPMAIDGFTQLFGLRESNWELRTLTGTLFGVGTIWLMYPYVEIGMKDARMAVASGLKHSPAGLSATVAAGPPSGEAKG